VNTWTRVIKYCPQGHECKLKHAINGGYCDGYGCRNLITEGAVEFKCSPCRYRLCGICVLAELEVEAALQNVANPPNQPGMLEAAGILAQGTLRGAAHWGLKGLTMGASLLQKGASMVLESVGPQPGQYKIQDLVMGGVLLKAGPSLSSAPWGRGFIANGTVVDIVEIKTVSEDGECKFVRGKLADGGWISLRVSNPSRGLNAMCVEKIRW